MTTLNSMKAFEAIFPIVNFHFRIEDFTNTFLHPFDTFALMEKDGQASPWVVEGA